MEFQEDRMQEVRFKMKAKEMFSRNALDIWLALNMSLTLLKQRGFSLSGSTKAAPLQTRLTIRHMKEKCLITNRGINPIWHFRLGNYVGGLCLNRLRMAKYLITINIKLVFFIQSHLRVGQKHAEVLGKSPRFKATFKASLLHINNNEMYIQKKKKQKLPFS